MKDFERASDGEQLGEKILVRVFSRKKQSETWNSEGNFTTVKPVRTGDRMMLVNLDANRMINTSPVQDAQWDGDRLLVSTMNSEYSLQPIDPIEPQNPREVQYLTEGVAKAMKSMLGMFGL